MEFEYDHDHCAHVSETGDFLIYDEIRHFDLWDRRGPQNEHVGKFDTFEQAVEHAKQCAQWRRIDGPKYLAELKTLSGVRMTKGEMSRVMKLLGDKHELTYAKRFNPKFAAMMAELRRAEGTIPSGSRRPAD